MMAAAVLWRKRQKRATIETIAREAKRLEQLAEANGEEPGLVSSDWERSLPTTSPPLLRPVVLVGEPALGSGFDLKRLGLGAVDLGDTERTCAGNASMFNFEVVAVQGPTARVHASSS